MAQDSDLRESVPPVVTAPGSAPAGGLRRVASSVGLLAVVVSAMFGGNVLGLREQVFGSETPTPRPAAVSRSSDAGDPGASVATQSVLRSQPWWQGVTTLSGDGSTTTPAVTIDAEAIQYRVTASCSTGRMLVRAPGQQRPVLDTACPSSEPGYGIDTGSVRLEVSADGPWELHVEQQVEVPLVEPPLPGMGAPGAAVVSGSFYRVDQVGTGSATIYRLPDGRYALRLEDFFVTANVDLELQLSTLEAPRTTEQIRDARSPTLASLDVTAGALNFVLPAGLDPTRYRSLVIWCELTSNAYAAARLQPA
ncbi:MAG: DM13 domain-containing protein [Mycobacteriales bacterium]